MIKLCESNIGVKILKTQLGFSLLLNSNDYFLLQCVLNDEKWTAYHALEFLQLTLLLLVYVLLNRTQHTETVSTYAQ